MSRNRTSNFLFRVLLFLGAFTTGCSTQDVSQVKQAPPVEKQKITIEVPKGEGIDSQPCDKPDWTRLPPPPEDPNSTSSGKSASGSSDVGPSVNAPNDSSKTSKKGAKKKVKKVKKKG